jgi:hypothetical protein
MIEFDNMAETRPPVNSAKRKRLGTDATESFS